MRYKILVIAYAADPRFSEMPPPCYVVIHCHSLSAALAFFFAAAFLGAFLALGFASTTGLSAFSTLSDGT